LAKSKDGEMRRGGERNREDFGIGRKINEYQKDLS